MAVTRSSDSFALNMASTDFKRAEFAVSNYSPLLLSEEKKKKKKEGTWEFPNISTGAWGRVGG